MPTGPFYVRERFGKMKSTASTYAFLGTSPSMSLVVGEAKAYGECVVIDSGPLGGAWAEIPFAKKPASLACNGIGSCLDSAAVFEGLEKKLRRMGAQLLRVSGPLPGRDPDGTDSHLVGRVIPAVQRMLTGRNVKIVRREVKEIEIQPTYAIIDGERYRGLFLPEHFKVNSFKFMGEELSITPKTIRSRHFRAFFSETPGGPHYDVDWDSVFDRAGLQYPDSRVFIGRVRRELKELPLAELMESSEWLAGRKELVVDCDLNEYESHWISAEDLTPLRGRLAGTTSSVIPTQDICRAFDFSKRLESVGLARV